jgi:hypothetical protein
MARVTLLLNTLLVVVNFILMLGQSSINDTTMRATIRAAFDVPVHPERSAGWSIGVADRGEQGHEPGAANLGPPAFRLYNYLAHSGESDMLSPGQWARVVDIMRTCDRDLRAGLGPDLATADSGDGIRRRVEITFERTRSMIREELERAGITDQRRRDRLASVIVASLS